MVVDWEYMESAARELFTIWHEYHDLKWARYAWSKLEKVPASADGVGEQIANSLVLLIALAMLSSAFWDAACEEPGDPQYSAADALTATGLDRFYIGQLWPYVVPQDGWARPHMNEILLELAAPAAQLYAREVLRKMEPAEVIQFFESVPFLMAERHGEADEAEHSYESALPKGIESQVLVRRHLEVTEWVSSGCLV